MLPQIIAALIGAQTGVHAPRVNARVVCDTIHSPVLDGAGEVAIVAAGDGGRVAWTDARDGRKTTNVLVRDAHGQVHTAGKRGEGPGEFAAITRLSWQGDTLWVSDGKLRRMQAFNSSGTFLSATPLRAGGGFSISPGGTLLGWNFVPPPPTAPGVIVGRQLEEIPLALMRLRAPESVADTLFRHTPVTLKDQSGAMSLMQRTTTTVSADGHFWCIMGAATTPGLQLHCIDHTGKITLTATQQFTTRPLTNAVWDSALTFYTKYTPRAEIEQMLHRAKDLPLGFDLLVNRSGDIWVSRSHPSEPTQIWDRMRSDGTRLPSITFKSRAQLRALDGNWYYAALTDTDDLQTLIRCPIP